MNTQQRRKHKFILGIQNKFLRTTHFEKHIKSIRINPNIFKYWEFRKSNVHFFTQKVI